jgi:uncharacterized membrane protein YraQ (UPF0718 family)
MAVPNITIGLVAAARQRMIILRYFFAVVCVILYGYFLSKFYSSISLLPITHVNEQEENNDQNHTLSSYKSSTLSSNADADADADNDKCGIWMAPSSLNPYPGNF